MELKPIHKTGALPFSKMAVDFIDYFIGSSLFPAQRVAAHWGTDTIHPAEFLDLFGMSPARVQREVFPILEPDYYLAKAQLADPDENLLEHFLLHGIHLEIDPHPLVSFDWMRFSRPDLFERPLTPQLFFSVFESNLISTSPFFDIAHYKRESLAPESMKSAFVDYVLRGSAKGHSPCRWFDPDHYRQTYPDAPADPMAALVHFINVGDGELRSPSDAFDPAWYQEQYSTARHQIEHPLHHFLRWGRLSRHAPRADGGEVALETRRGRRMEHSGGNLVYEPKPESFSETYRRARTMAGAALTRGVMALRHTPDDSGPATRPDAQRDRPPAAEFSSDPAPSVEVLVHNAAKLFPVTRTLRALRHAARALANTHSLAVTVVFDQAEQELEAAQSLARKAGGAHLAHWEEGLPLKTRAPHVLLLSAGTEVTAETLTELLSGLTGTSDTVATAPLIVNSSGALVTAGGMTQPDGAIAMVGQGMSPETCPWARDRNLPWAPLTALLVARDRLDAIGPDAGRCLKHNKPVDLAMALRGKGQSIRLAAKARATRRTGVRHPARDFGETQRIGTMFAPQIANDLRLRVIAQFFPHFAPDDLVQQFNGPGATDWLHVGKSHPGFVGHYQPHIPGELGYYDSRIDDVLDQQIAMARRHGVDGFLLRYYNLNGQRVLSRSYDQICAGKFAGFQHALCWDTNGLAAVIDPVEKGFAPPQQEFDDQTIANVLADAVAAAQIDGAITVNGNPLFAVSDITRLPDAAAFAAAARQAFRAAGFPDVHLALLSPDQDSAAFGHAPAEFGFDSMIQDPPHGVEAPQSKRGAKSFRSVDIRMEDYRDVVTGAIRAAMTPHLTFPGLCTGWDDTPLRRVSHRVLLDPNPAAFQAWAQTAIDALDMGSIGDDRLLFVTAWNHWSHGAHLEPDHAFGQSWLQALGTARQTALAPTTVPFDARRARAPGRGGSLAILIHAYYLDVFQEMLEMMIEEQLTYPLYVTCPEQNADGVAQIAAQAGIPVTIMVCDNHGRDVLPFLTSVQRLQADGHKYLLKLHTKKSPHRTDGHLWRKELFGPFLNRSNLERVLSVFDTTPSMGMTGPETHILPLSDHLEENRTHLATLAERLGVDYEMALARDTFVAGTMFFARFSTLVPVLKLALTKDEFEDEGGQVDGTLAHALERVFGLSCRLNGRDVVPLETVLGASERRRPRARTFHQ